MTSPLSADTLDSLLEGRLQGETLQHTLALLAPHRATKALVAQLQAALWDRRAPAFVQAHQALNGLAVLDTCGSGGSGQASFNTSTTVAFVAAAAGVPVIKFGNRAASSASGSSDFLSALGINLTEASAQWRRQLETLGLAFITAPSVYPGLATLAPARKAFGKPTLFNVLGPTLNPVQPAYRLMGHSFEVTLPLVAQWLATQPTNKQSLIVRSEGGLDELVPQQAASGFWVREGQASPWKLPPSVPGLATRHSTFTPEENVALFKALITADECTLRQQPVFAQVVLNAGAALWLAGKAPYLEEGQALAVETLCRGQVLQLVKQVLQ